MNKVKFYKLPGTVLMRDLRKCISTRPPRVLESEIIIIYKKRVIYGNAYYAKLMQQFGESVFKRGKFNMIKVGIDITKSTKNTMKLYKCDEKLAIERIMNDLRRLGVIE